MIVKFQVALAAAIVDILCLSVIVSHPPTLTRYLTIRKITVIEPVQPIRLLSNRFTYLVSTLSCSATHINLTSRWWLCSLPRTCLHDTHASSTTCSHATVLVSTGLSIAAAYQLILDAAIETGYNFKCIHLYPHSKVLIFQDALMKQVTIKWVWFHLSLNSRREMLCGSMDVLRA